MTYSKRDLGSLSRHLDQGLSRIIQEAFDQANGGGLICDVKMYGAEGNNSYFFWDYSEDKCFIQRTTEDTDPGRLVYIQHLTSAVAAGGSCQGMQIRARATGTGTIAGGTDGAEIKAGLNSDADTGTLADARAIIGNIDAKKGTITEAKCFEASADIGSGGTITTLYGFRAFLNSSGTCTTGYAFYVDAEAAEAWDYGLYVEAGMADIGVYVGANATGIQVDAVTTSILTGTASFSGSDALTGISLTITDACTQSTGNSKGIDVQYTSSGAKTGGGMIPINTDMYVTEDQAEVTGYSQYLDTVVDKTISTLIGISIYWADHGDDVTNLVMLDLGKNCVHVNVDGGRNNFIRFREHSAVQTNSVGIGFEGLNAVDYAFQFDTDNQNCCLIADYHSNTSDRVIKVKLAVGDRYIQLYQAS